MIMTGRELIIYILENDLENEPVFQDDKLIGFLSEREAAVKLNVGIETIRTMIELNVLEGISIGNTFYIPANYYLFTLKD